MGANELGLECWFTILQEHLHDFGQVGEELVIHLSRLPRVR